MAWVATCPLSYLGTSRHESRARYVATRVVAASIDWPGKQVRHGMLLAVRGCQQGG